MNNLINQYIIKEKQIKLCNLCFLRNTLRKIAKPATIMA